MTTEAPDGPMPICMSPESFRAAVDRAKKAEQRVEELMSTLDRMTAHRDKLGHSLDATLDENEALTANVATLVEQLGEAERRASAFRDLLEKLRQQPDVPVAFLHVIEKTLNARQYAGAAQPVVEPRDETKPPPGWYEDGFDTMRGDSPLVSRSATTFRTLAQAWAIFKDEHRGYAPHPSGTEGPLRELLAEVDETAHAIASERWADGGDRSRTLLALFGLQNALRKHIDAAFAASPPDGTAPERARRIVGKGTCAVEWCDNDKVPDHGFCEAHATAEQIAAAENWTPGSVDRLAESKARRAAEMAADAKRLHEELSRLFGIEYEADVDYVWAPGPVDELLKYADELQREHIARQESATRPPDGMHGEPALPPGPWDEWRTKLTYTGRPCGCEFEARVVCSKHCGGHGIPGPWPIQPAAPPTVPGEPADVRLALADAEQRLADLQESHDLLEGQLIELRAAPPTVPGEPPRRRKRCEGVVEPVGINRTDATPPTPPLTPEECACGVRWHDGLDRCPVCGRVPLTEVQRVANIAHEFGQHDSECDYVSGAGPCSCGWAHASLPPYTGLTRAPAECICPPNAMAVRCPKHDPPERAPLDEAAVRADERRRTERDIAAWLGKNATLHSQARMSLHDASLIVHRSDYPRRSEGAG